MKEYSLKRYSADADRNIHKNIAKYAVNRYSTDADENIHTNYYCRNTL